jgi:hypothetical protein
MFSLYLVSPGARKASAKTVRVVEKGYVDAPSENCRLTVDPASTGRWQSFASVHNHVPLLHRLGHGDKSAQDALRAG